MSLQTERIQAICFDVDGTLHDTDDLFVLRLVKWLHPLRFVIPNKDPKPLARRIVMQTETPATFLYGLPDRLGLDDEIAAIMDLIYELGLGKNPQPFCLIDGVRNMLDQLFHQYPMSVVSARGERSTLHFLETFHIQSYFQAIATAQTCRHTKPYPDPILWAAAQMKVPPENCLMIGDTTVDILSGKAAGAQTAGVLCGFGKADELVRCGADIILPTTSYLQKVLLDK
jgi:N-acetyl-D-muramate 6-phosphate phosphatase